MGKRKKSSRKPQGPRKRDPLATVFTCLFCNHEASVSVRIDRKTGVGNLSCKSCGQNFQTSVHNLSQPTDVYADWIDACEAVANDPTTASTTTTMGAPRRPRPVAASSGGAGARAGLAPGEKYTDDDDGFIEDDEVDAEADYGDE